MFRRYLIPTVNSLARAITPHAVKNSMEYKCIPKDTVLCRSLAASSVPEFSADKLEKASYEDVKSLANDKKVVIIDVREPNELVEHGILPGSINIPCEVEQAFRSMSSEQFLQKYGRSKPDEATPVVFSCMRGIRSEKAQIVALQLGYKDVKNYLGGWNDWAEKNKK